MSNPIVMVLSRDDAVKFSHTTDYATYAIVSINDSKSHKPEFFDSPYLEAVEYFFFDDLDCEEDRGEFARMYTVISDNDAASIAKFVNEWYNKVDILVIHCYAGISRSAGCAAAILEHFTGDASQIYNDKNKVPNKLVYEKVLNALKNEEKRNEQI